MNPAFLFLSTWPALVSGGAHGNVHEHRQILFSITFSSVYGRKCIFKKKGHLRNARVGEPHDNNLLRQWGLLVYSCEHHSKATIHK